MIKLKRVHEPASPKHGIRILVERMRPRGLTRECASVDLWLKDVAPSPGLRKRFGHDPAGWEQFQERYRQELREKKALQLLKEESKRSALALVYAARDEEHNSALVVNAILQDHSVNRLGEWSLLETQ